MLEKIVRITSMSCFLLFSLILGVHANDNGFVIQLKNGNTFETRTYHEDGNMVYFDRYGTRIGIDKGTVETIQPKQVVSAVAVDNSVEYMGHLRMPGYYRVSGLADRGRPTYNGLYEERGKHNDRPRYKQINGSNDLFYHRVSRRDSRYAWALGRLKVHSKSISFVNIQAPEAKTPDAAGVWTTSTGQIMKPELKVASVQPPPLVYEGRYTYLAEGFAFDELNGLYKPHSYHEGKLRYRHETYSYELFFSSTWVLARCKKNCFTQYKSGPVYVDHFPHDIETWFDSNGRVSQGKFTIHKQHR